MKKHNQLSEWQTQFFGTILELNETFYQSAIPMKNMSAKDCCSIYQNGYSARLTEALGDTFESTWWVLGDETFFERARHFISHIPSRSFDLSDYGLEFPEYLSQTELKEEIPFLIDLANFEWIFKTLFHSTDISDDDKSHFIESLQKNNSLDLTLHSSVRLFQSLYSIYEIWKRRGNDISELSHLDIENESYFVCYKTKQKVFVKLLSKSEYNILKRFEKGTTLEMALTGNYNEQDLSPEEVQNFFSELSSLGLIALK